MTHQGRTFRAVEVTIDRTDAGETVIRTTIECGCAGVVYGYAAVDVEVRPAEIAPVRVAKPLWRHPDSGELWAMGTPSPAVQTGLDRAALVAAWPNVCRAMGWPQDTPPGITRRAK